MERFNLVCSVMLVGTPVNDPAAARRRIVIGVYHGTPGRFERDAG
jgi:hypothetical protein